MKTLLLVLAFVCSSCSAWFAASTSSWEYDDLYVRSYVRPGYIYRDPWSPLNPYLQYNQFYSAPRYFYDRPNVIIIRPEVKPTVPGKRPSREGGQYNPNFQPQRGRRQ